MAERYSRDPDPNHPDNPPNSVVNRHVRKSALRTYLWPLVVFFVVLAAAMFYRNSDRQPSNTGPNGAGSTVASDAQGTEGARGTTGARPTDPDTPGGHEPQRTPSTTSDELEHRSGNVVTELGDLLDERAMTDAGRRVHVDDVEVEKVDNATTFWVRDGNARVEVIANQNASVRAGQHVTIVGTAERSGEVLRIRATSVKPSKD